jgi:hypothetical protein
VIGEEIAKLQICSMKIDLLNSTECGLQLLQLLLEIRFHRRLLVGLQPGERSL